MKQYFKNLCLVILGRNPFQEEVDTLKKQLEKAAENMRSLQDQLYSALEKWDEGTKKWEKSDAMVTGLLQLTENLRERIADKDRMIAQLEEELSKK